MWSTWQPTTYTKAAAAKPAAPKLTPEQIEELKAKKAAEKAAAAKA